MRIIDSPIKEIILEEEEKILITTLKGNKQKVQIVSKNGTLEIDNISMKKIEQLKEEQIAIEAMKLYQKKQTKN